MDETLDAENNTLDENAPGNLGKIGTPDKLKVPKAFKYPERYTSPTDQMMSPVTRGIIARSKKGSKLLPPFSVKIPALQLQELDMSQVDK